MYRPFALSPRAIHLLLILVVILQLVVAAPAVAKDESTRGSAIAAVEDTGSYEDIFEAAENQAPIETKIPSKEETSHQLHVYKLQPLTFAHRVEGILRVIGLGDYTNVILDSLCLLAYAYLLRLTSKSRWYAVEAMQMLGFFCFPALPIIQFTNNLCRTAMRALYDGSSGLRHTLSCVVGQYAVSTPSSPPQLLLNEKLQASESQATTAPLVRQRLTHVMSHELDFSHGPALSLIRRFGGLLLAGLTIVASITTLHIHVDHPVRSDWDSVGIASDQRHGWLSSSATVASLLSVLALLINSRWSIKPEFTTPDAAVGLLGETEVSLSLFCVPTCEVADRACHKSIPSTRRNPSFLSNPGIPEPYLILFLFFSNQLG